MEIAFTLLAFTMVYGLGLLSFYPEKYFRKFSYRFTHKNVPEYRKFKLSEPMFFSFLGGYILAFVVVYFMYR